MEVRGKVSKVRIDIDGKMIKARVRGGNRPLRTMV